MIYIKSKSSKTLAKKVLLKFKKEIAALNKNKIVIGLCGGSSVGKFYQEIGRRFNKLPHYKNLHFFMIDERVNKNQRNSKVVKENLIDNIPKTIRKKIKDNFHFLENLSFEKYGNLLASFGGKFDIIIASAGEDGHFASLFPQHKLLNSNKMGYGFLNDSPKAPSERITILPQTVKKSKTCFLFFINKKKETAYKKLTQASSEKKYPCAILKNLRLYIATNLTEK